MAARPPYPNTPFAGAASYSGLPHRRASSSGRLSRIGYVAAWALLGVASVVGLTFSLYRNDVLLTLARRGGWEPRYLALEARLLGTPGWGTPRSLAPEAAPTAVPGPPVADTASAPIAVSAAPAAAKPAPAERLAAPPAPSNEEPRATKDGVTIVSLDALATLPVEPTRPAVPSAPIARAPAPVAPVAKAVSAPAPPARPAAPSAPVAKAVAAPARPVVAPPSPPPNENPLKAAIRSAIVKESQAK